MARRRNKFTEEDAARVVNLRAEGVPWGDVGKQVNLTLKACEEAYEAGSADVETTSRLVQLFDKLQDKLLQVIDMFPPEELKELSPSQRAVLFGIMIDKVGPLQKVLGDSLGADHMQQAPTMQKLLAASKEDFKEINSLMGRMAAKETGTAELSAKLKTPPAHEDTDE